MKERHNHAFVLAHGFLAVLLVLVFLQKQRATVRPPGAMLVALAVMEIYFLVRYRKSQKRSTWDIALFLWMLLIVWELCTSVLNVAHPVLVPCPENVFDTLREQFGAMALNVLYSMELLSIGFCVGMMLAVGLGLIVGWIPRLREFAYPIANVMAPIPPIVFSPYLVALMPSFRSASALVIILGVFWPNFLGTINRVSGMEPEILDCAKMLHLSDSVMIFRVLLPYALPGIVSSLKVSVTTSLLMLNFAEIMGAAHGMGYYVQNSITYANYTHAVAGIICIGLVVTVLNWAVTAVQRHAIRWR